MKRVLPFFIFMLSVWSLAFSQTGRVGIGTTNPLAPLHVDSTVLFTGTFDNSPLALPVSGSGSRLMWVPRFGAFRAGYAENTVWDAQNVGVHSAALNYSNTAKGYSSTALGFNTSALGASSLAAGQLTVADGEGSAVFGGGTKAGAMLSFALGRFNKGIGDQVQWDDSDPLFEIGIGTSNTERKNAMTIYKNAGALWEGEYDPATPDPPPAEGPGTRMMWYPDRGAFRVGRVSDTEWDSINIGNFSMALGDKTIASGFRSTAMGYSNTASGSRSTAMGSRTKAAGNYSTAMGNGTLADSYGSLAIGRYNVGGGTPASFIDTEAILEIGIGEVSGTDTIRRNAMTIYKNAGALWEGEYSLSPDHPPTEGPGTRMMWYPEKAAFRAGSVEGIQWDKDSIGFNSIALGYNTTASGGGATAFGSYTRAAEPSSTAFGYYTEALGAYATAMGYSSEASGSASTALGYGSTASGYHSIAMGEYAYAPGVNAMAIGTSLHATGTKSTAIGYGATASGDYATAIGNYPTASMNTSTAFGYYTHASGDYATVMGKFSTASGPASTAMGSSTTASGESSTAMGTSTIADGVSSTALGKSTKADSYASLAIGHYNIGGALNNTAIDPEDPVFEVGIGTSISDRRNAMTLYKNAGALWEGGFDGAAPDPPPAEGAGTRMMWYPEKAAFRAGHVSGLQWDQSSIGNYSIGLGYDAVAFGLHSFAAGYSTSASGWYATAMGQGTLAQAFNCTAIGRYNEGKGTSSSLPQSTDPIFEIGNGTGASVSERNNAMTVLRNGNVGIGTSSPGNHRLYIQSSGTGTSGTTGYIENTSLSGVAMQVINSSNSSIDVPLLVTTRGTGDILKLETFQGTSSWNLRFRFKNNGDAVCDGNWQSTGADYAEYFRKEKTGEKFAPGDVISFSSKTPYAVTKATPGYRQQIAGVMSSAPAIVGNSSVNGVPEDAIIVGLMGIVETKVSADNGAISTGDFLTISSEPGVAAKAVSTGMVIGRAVEPFNGSKTGLIKVMVRPEWVQFDQQTQLNQLKAENAEIKAALQLLMQKMETSAGNPQD